MKPYYLALLLLTFLGCEDEKNPMYEGSVKLEKVNGKVIEVQVEFPGPCKDNRVVLETPEQVETMRSQLQSMLKDIEYAKEQMSVNENVLAQ